MTYMICELVEVEVEVSPATLDDAGNVITPAITKKEFVQREREATQEEAAEIDARKAEASNPGIARKALIDQIDKLERDSLLNRGSRELELRLMEKEAVDLAAEAGVTVETYLATVPYYVRLKALNDQIAVLRAQL